MISYHYQGLTKVISGGQTGSDQAGLYVAKRMGIQTGGSIGKGFRTAAGNNPSLAQFNLIECTTSEYPHRTKANAQDGNATVRLASNFQSAGELLTLRACNYFKKPVCDIKLDGTDHDNKAEQLVKFIQQHSVQILNVAGNADRDKEFGFHFHDASIILEKAFQLLDERGLLIRL